MTADRVAQRRVIGALRSGGPSADAPGAARAGPRLRVRTVVVSKETPLHDPAKVFRSAMDSLVGPGRVAGLLFEAAEALDPDSSRYAELTRWLHSSAGPDERLSATF